MKLVKAVAYGHTMGREIKMIRYGTRTTYRNMDGITLPSWLQLLPLVFVITGAVILFFGIRQIQQANASLTWPSVPGVVTVSELGKHISNDDNDSTSSTTSTTYSADITYDYLVDDVSYVSSAIQFGQVSSSDPAVARTVLKQYEVGKAVNVYYNPEKPSQSVLEPGLQGGTWFLPIFGSLFLVVGIVFSYLMLKWRRAQA